MTNANMKLATVTVWFDDELETPVPHLEPGEHIVTKVVPLSELYDKLQGAPQLLFISNLSYDMHRV